MLAIPRTELTKNQLNIVIYIIASWKTFEVEVWRKEVGTTTRSKLRRAIVLKYGATVSMWIWRTGYRKRVGSVQKNQCSLSKYCDKN